MRACCWLPAQWKYLWITVRCFLCEHCSWDSWGLCGVWNAENVQLNAEWWNTVLKMLQKANNCMKLMQAAWRRGLCYGFTHKITPQPELPNSPAPPVQAAEQLSDLAQQWPFPSSSACSALSCEIRMCHCVLQRSKQYFLILTIQALQLQGLKSVQMCHFLSVFLFKVCHGWPLIHISVFSLP